METRSAWRTNRLAIIGFCLGIFALITSPPFFMLLETIVIRFTGDTRYSHTMIWNPYYDAYISGDLIIRGGNVLLCWVISLTGLIMSIISIAREQQKRWIAITGIVLGIYGILAHFLGIFMLIMP